MEIKVTGVEQAAREYRINDGGNRFDPNYCLIMMDVKTGEVWTDYFYSLGHNEWKVYHDPDVITLFPAGYGKKLRTKDVMARAEKVLGMDARAAEEYIDQQR